jgi:hypothetical protein
MAEHIETAADTEWDRRHAMNYIIENHTWDTRTVVYDRVIREQLALLTTSGHRDHQ